MTGKDLAELVYEWANSKRIHPNDFEMMFGEELIELLAKDDEVFTEKR